MNVPVDPDGSLGIVDGLSAPGKAVVLRAETDVLVLVSNCPQINNPCNGFDPTPVRVVVNRMRGSLGWSESDVYGMVSGFVRHAGIHFLPDDRPTVDRALVTGSTLVAQGDAPVVRALAAVADALVGPAGPPATGRRIRPRRAGRARQR